MQSTCNHWLSANTINVIFAGRDQQAGSFYENLSLVTLCVKLTPDDKASQVLFLRFHTVSSENYGKISFTGTAVLLLLSSLSEPHR